MNVAHPTITVLSLCSGVGMLDVGLHEGMRAAWGADARTVCYVERESAAASLLLARMAEEALEPAPIWCGNLEAFDWRAWAGAVDCIVAGFPCQPHSQAGKRAGTADERWIWPAIADGIRLVRPAVVYLENVAGLRSSGGMAPVLSDLVALGFDIEWDSIRASDVGAAHQRERVFILAYRPQLGRPQGRPESGGQQGRPDVAECGVSVAHATGERLGEARHAGGRRPVGTGGAVAALGNTAGLGRETRPDEPSIPQLARGGGELADTVRIGRDQGWTADGAHDRPDAGPDSQLMGYAVSSNVAEGGVQR